MIFSPIKRQFPRPFGVAYLQQLANGINANKGKENCGQCALRFDAHLAIGKNLNLGPVSTLNANMQFKYVVKHNQQIEYWTADSRMLLRTGKTPTDNIGLSATLPDEQRFGTKNDEHPTHRLLFQMSSKAQIINTLKQLPRRSKDQTSYGFILLKNNSQDPNRMCHILNYFVDNDDQVYFIDTQKEHHLRQIYQNLDHLQNTAIFYRASVPPEGIQNDAKQEESAQFIQKYKAQEYFSHLYSKCSHTDAKSEDFVKLGDAYFQGTGTIKNDHLSYKCYKRAIEKENLNAIAWLRLGHCHKNGRGIARNDNNAFNCYQRASNADNKLAHAWLNLGLCYRKGAGTAPNQPLAFQCFKTAIAIDPNIALAWLGAGYCYLKGTGVAVSSKDAFEHLYKATKLDHRLADAWLGLGQCYRDGFGTKANPTLAFDCFTKCTQLDPKKISAWKNLAQCYQQGIGTKKDPIKAKEALDTARGLELDYIFSRPSQPAQQHPVQVQEIQPKVVPLILSKAPQKEQPLRRSLRIANINTSLPFKHLSNIKL
ncbi:MAG: tetratricopeptide repeat protein [Candidatus Berkiella sp.]